MKTFEEIWQLLAPKAEYANRRRACYQLWETLTEEEKDNIYDTISDKLSKGLFVDYNPFFALKNNNQRPRRQTLSFNDYYARYGTTEERDGWRMENPTGQKVIYVRQQ